MAWIDGLRRWLPWLVAYVVVLVAVIVTTFQTRSWALEQLATPKSVDEWQTWRDDVRQQQDRPGPVQRRVPKSSEPPALVMMRDHFGVSLVGTVLFSTMLYWVFAGLVMGILKSSNPRSTRDYNSSI